MTEVLRTPEHRFARLSGYPYPAHSLALDDDGELHLAYVAEGAHDNRPVLLLHGPPTWSYLWRSVIPMLVEGGCRVVAPDLVGFGRSAKLGRAHDHRLDRHLGWLVALVEALDLRHATVVAHGAAALLSLRLLAGAGDRFAGAVGVCPLFAAGIDAPPSEAVVASELVAQGCAGALSDGTRGGYDAPFPEAEHCAGLRAQAGFVTGSPADLPPIEIPILGVAGDKDAVADAGWMSHVPGPQERRRRITIGGAGHYLPEDRGPELALALLAFMGEAA
jgi:haloalkane dehalogenase